MNMFNLTPTEQPQRQPADQKSEVQVSCLRKSSRGSSTADLRFVRPDNPDTAFVPRTDVVHLLPKPISERRGVVYSGRIFTAAGFVVE